MVKRINFYNNGDNFITALVAKLKSLGEPFTGIIGLDGRSDIYFLQRSSMKTAGVWYANAVVQAQLLTEDGLRVYTKNGEEIIISLDHLKADISNRLYYRYCEKWESLAKALQVDWDVLKSRKDTYTSTPRSSKNTEHYKSQDIVTETNDRNSTTEYQGFNSTAFQPQNKTTTGGSVHTTGDKDKNYEKTMTTQDGMDTIVHEYEGNGVDERIMERIRLRSNQIMEIMRKDIDKFLTLPIYRED